MASAPSNFTLQQLKGYVHPNCSYSCGVSVVGAPPISSELCPTSEGSDGFS
jgi:hypothetical protein